MAGSIPPVYVTSTAPLISRTNPSRPSPPRFRPPVAAMSRASSYWASVNAEIEAHLRRAVQAKPPHSVYRPLQHFTVTAPADMAPALCVATWDLVGGSRDREKAVAAASALRLLHAALLTHDPLVEARGPKSMADGPYGPNKRLLIGDGMVPLAMELLARSDYPGSDSSGRILRVMIEMTRAIGSRGAIEGQYRKTLQRRRRRSDGEGFRSSQVEDIRQTSEKIEGTLHACAAACGAILGGGSEDEIDRLRNYGLNVGKMEGILSRGGGQENGAVMKEVEEMRDLAIKELRDFEGKNVEALYSLIDKYWA